MRWGSWRCLGTWEGLNGYEGWLIGAFLHFLVSLLLGRGPPISDPANVYLAHDIRGYTHVLSPSHPVSLSRRQSPSLAPSLKEIRV